MPHVILKDSDHEVKERGYILGEAPFKNYRLNQFFSPYGFKLFVVPEGYKGVRLRLGDRLKLGGIQIGQEIEPGIRFMLGLKSLWSSVAVVNTQTRTLEMKMAEEDEEDGGAISADGVEFTSVTAGLNWRVERPLDAMTKAEDYKFTVRQTAEGRVREYIGSHTFPELLNVNYKKEGDLSITPRLVDLAKDYETPKLKEIGTTLENLFITHLDIPDELRKLLSQQAQGRSEAQAQYELALKRVDIAKKHKEAAVEYADPVVRFVATLDIAKELAQNGRTISLNGPGGLMEAVEGYFGRIPTSEPKNQIIVPRS